MKKCKQRYADGGVVAKETPEQLMARMAAKYGVGASSSAPEPAQAPRPAAQAVAPAGQSVSIGRTIDAVSRRNDELRKAANYANGGVVQRIAEFRGKGGPTDDQIPVKVAGHEINVSDGEKAVILPAKTAKNPQAIAQIESIIEATNGATPNSALKDGGKYAMGAVQTDDEVRRQLFRDAAKSSATPTVIDGVRYADKPVVPNPLSLLASGYGETTKAMLPSFENRAAERLAQNRAELNGEEAPPQQQATKPQPPAVTAAAPAPASTQMPEPPQAVIQATRGADGRLQVTNTGTGDVKAPLDNTAGMQSGNAALARENAIRQEMIDRQQPGGAVAIADQGRAETQALMDKWGREQSVQSIAQMNPRTAQAAAQLIAAGGHDAATAAGHDVTRRGQDIAARTQGDEQRNRLTIERERLAGNTLDQEGKRLGNASLQRIASLQETIMDKNADAATRESAARNLMALTGKADPTPYRAFQVGGGTNLDGSKEAADVAVVNERTGQVMRSGKDGSSAAAAIPPVESREVGKAYDTPKGKMIWRGNGWEPVK